uniref:embryogenesis-associated protein EMB8-like n=1 Tax=Erigeron canadensis TaxID=72917 RepID=UPI001CB8F521|nr:embryogenesis-associated protein EMB8-like [Erigeron canadensis]
METKNSINGSPYHLILKSLTLIPITHYLLVAFLAFVIFVYNLFEMHIIDDIFSGFGGNHVTLTFESSSELYRDVVSKCHLLHKRYFSTPWISGPHLQTILLNLLVKTPKLNYERELFLYSDGGTVALDWLMNFDETNFQVNGSNTDAKVVPLVIVVPGLTSYSESPYIKHIAYMMAKRGWNVVIYNHRGLAGVPLTSDCVYHPGWTEDLRQVVNHIHNRQPETPLYAIGTSIGANVLVKYLGEDGVNVPLVGAASICNPWDLLMGDRFLARGLRQRFYDKILVNGLQNIARQNQDVYARVGNWEGTDKAQTVGEFNNYSSRLTGDFETVDAYHRWASSARLVMNVKVPLLCINAMDDPVCTNEAIPFDECRKNKNIVLATTQHGGHIAFFEGMAGKDLWWAKVVEEYLSVLHSNKLIAEQTTGTTPPNGL